MLFGRLWRLCKLFSCLTCCVKKGRFHTCFAILRFRVDIWHLIQTFSSYTIIAWFWWWITDEGLLPETIAKPIFLSRLTTCMVLTNLEVSFWLLKTKIHGAKGFQIDRHFQCINSFTDDASINAQMVKYKYYVHASY